MRQLARSDLLTVAAGDGVEDRGDTSPRPPADPTLPLEELAEAA